MIRIKSQQEGFRRCGVAHPGSWTEHPDAAFTAEELEALKAEPMLQVQTGADAEDSGGSSGGLTCKKLTGILTRMGVEVPKPPVKKADLEALLDKALNEARPFTVADATCEGLLADIRQAVDKAISTGTTLEEFRKDFASICDRAGWSPKGSEA